MNKEDEKKERKEEVERIYRILLNAIPLGVKIGDVVVALNQLSMEFATAMGESDYDELECEHDEEDFKDDSWESCKDCQEREDCILYHNHLKDDISNSRVN